LTFQMEKGPGRGTTYPFRATCAKWKTGMVGGREERSRERRREQRLPMGLEGRMTVIESFASSRVTRGRGRGYARTTERTFGCGNTRGGRPLSEGERRLFCYEGTLGINATRGATHGWRAGEASCCYEGTPRASKPTEETRGWNESRSRYEADSGENRTSRRTTERASVAARKGPWEENVLSKEDPLQGVLRNCVGTSFEGGQGACALESVCGGDPRAEIDEPEERPQGTRGVTNPEVTQRSSLQESRMGLEGANFQATRGRIVGGPSVQPPKSTDD